MNNRKPQVTKVQGMKIIIIIMKFFHMLLKELFKETV